MEPSAPSSEAFGNVDTLWILISAALVFFMQAGFKVLETGLVKTEHRSGIGVKNLMDWVAGSLAFFLIGFGLMFGESSGGLIGTTMLLGDFTEGYTYVFFIFQLAFAGTALTIVSGAMSGRTALGPYFVASLFTAIIVYPVFGHWAWGNLLIESNEPWLASLGFMDFAGSTVVHSVGAWVGLVGIGLVGPRLGRYNALGTIQPVKASDYAYSVLGLMILWLGWWGFNGGSTLGFDTSVPIIILNTNLAAAAACLSAYLHAKFAQKNKDLIEKVIGGSLTGLVAITACCNVVTPINSIVIGLLAGLIHNLAYILISEKWKLDDPVGAIPVHGFGGVFGTLCVALFGQEELLVHSRWTQLGVQSIGVVVCIAFTVTTAFAVFYIIKFTFGLRLSPMEEKSGAVFGMKQEDLLIENELEKTVSQVSVRMGESSYNLFKVNEYLNLPRETRVGLIRTESVQYLDESGNEVPTLEAVRYLSGVIEQQRDQGKSQEELVELTLFKERENVIGSLQDILLGEDHSIISVFPNSFVILEAKGKVSSDFYWHGKEKGYRIAVAASCYDPDISNAFISALTVSQLNEIVGIKKILPPEKILTILDDKISLALQSSGSAKNANGLEIGILVVDNNKRTAYYSASGTGIKLYVKKLEQALQEHKGIDIPLGNGARKFERVKIDYSKGDAFFLCSDGFANQLNESGKRYSTTQLRDFLEQNAARSMKDQKMLIGEEYAGWKGTQPQTEDILIMGIKP
ncbi:ammonium transporter [Marinoscillum sp.]|uniref:ammonium transporter n=1 Tax=Marinoscillum sp. TaxID=2024838 RepID=UPI003BA8D32D